MADIIENIVETLYSIARKALIIPVAAGAIGGCAVTTEVVRPDVAERHQATPSIDVMKEIAALDGDQSSVSQRDLDTACKMDKYKQYTEALKCPAPATPAPQAVPPAQPTPAAQPAQPAPAPAPQPAAGTQTERVYTGKEITEILCRPGVVHYLWNGKYDNACKNSNFTLINYPDKENVEGLKQESSDKKTTLESLIIIQQQGTKFFDIFTPLKADRENAINFVKQVAVDTYNANHDQKAEISDVTVSYTNGKLSKVKVGGNRLAIWRTGSGKDKAHVMPFTEAAMSEYAKLGVFKDLEKELTEKGVIKTPPTVTFTADTCYADEECKTVYVPNKDATCTVSIDGKEVYKDEKVKAGEKKEHKGIFPAGKHEIKAVCNSADGQAEGKFELKVEPAKLVATASGAEIMPGLETMISACGKFYDREDKGVCYKAKALVRVPILDKSLYMPISIEFAGEINTGLVNPDKKDSKTSNNHHFLTPMAGLEKVIDYKAADGKTYRFILRGMAGPAFEYVGSGSSDLPTGGVAKKDYSGTGYQTMVGLVLQTPEVALEIANSVMKINETMVTNDDYKFHNERTDVKTDVDLMIKLGKVVDLGLLFSHMYRSDGGVSGHQAAPGLGLNFHVSDSYDMLIKVQSDTLHDGSLITGIELRPRDGKGARFSCGPTIGFGNNHRPFEKYAIDCSLGYDFDVLK